MMITRILDDQQSVNDDHEGQVQTVKTGFQLQARWRYLEKASTELNFEQN